MKTKKIFNYLLSISVFWSLLASCTTEGVGLLDKTESGDLTEERVFSDGNYANDFLTDIYRRIPNGFYENVYLDAATEYTFS